MSWHHIVLSSLLTLALATANADAQQPAGSAERVNQGAEQRTAATSAVLNVGDTVFTNAVLATDQNGAASVVLEDGTSLTLSALSEITLDAYVYNPSGGDRFAARMGVGVLRFVSGQIAKDAVKIETPVVVVGIRGTTFTLDSRTPGLLRVWLEEGEVVLTANASGAAFTFQAPAQVVCNSNACRLATLAAPPNAFGEPSDTSGQSSGDVEGGSDGGSGGSNSRQ